MIDLNDVLVVSFCTNERTSKFNAYCIEKLGFKNSIQISDNSSFKEKYIKFAKEGLATQCKHFIRIDGDHFVFDGIFDLLNEFVEKEYDWLTGVVHDYVMDNFRGGTPQILSRKVLQILLDDNSLMPERQKPESEYSNNIRSMTKMGDVKILTALHEYEQYPSKVCNSFLNRIHRRHLYLYRQDYLNSLPEHYRIAIAHAFDHSQKLKSKVSMSFEDFGFLDSNFKPIPENKFDEMFEKYNKVYQNVKSKYAMIK